MPAMEYRSLGSYKESVREIGKGSKTLHTLCPEAMLSTAQGTYGGQSTERGTQRGTINFKLACGEKQW